MKEKDYACSPILAAKTGKDLSKSNVDLTDRVIRHFDDKYDNYSRRMEKHRRSSSVATSATSVITSGSSNNSSSNGSHDNQNDGNKNDSAADAELLTEDEKMKIDICFRGLKTQVMTRFSSFFQYKLFETPFENKLITKFVSVNAYSVCVCYA